MVKVVGFNILFPRMVVLMVKWAIATIPAMIAPAVIGMGLFAAGSLLLGLVAALLLRQTSQDFPPLPGPAVVRPAVPRN